MKPIHIIFILLLAAVAGAAGWVLGRRSTTSSAATPGTDRKILYYQSAMHPWIKSDKPGNCTICGMKLTPVFEGEKGFANTAGFVALATNQISVLNIQTEAVASRVLQRTLTVAGRIEPDETSLRVISAYFDGRIEKLAVNFTGAEVQAGQPLAEIYSPTLLTLQREYITLLASAPSTNSARLREEHLRLVEGARERLRRLGLANAQLDAITPATATNLAVQILAPISGTVIARNVSEGQYVKVGDKLFELADLSRIWFRFEVYERDLPLIRPGQPIQVTLPSLGNQQLEGIVRFVDPIANDATRAARVRVELENPLLGDGPAPRRTLLNNLFAQGEIKLATDLVLAVPRRAVINPGDRPRVYIQNNGAYEQRPVELGRHGEGYYEVLGGLSEGEQVVTEGNLLIDSQAEMDRSTHAQPAAPPQVAPVKIELTADQKSAAQKLFQSLSVLSQALASDDLSAARAAWPPVQNAFTAAHHEFASTPLHELIGKAESAAAQSLEGDLAQVRLRLLPFSNALASFALELRQQTTLEAKVFACPMYPKPGQTAYWIQTNAPLRNPFYGAEMLECGKEVIAP